MKTLIVAHDAGGANILLHWAKCQDSEFHYLLAGAAEKIAGSLGISNAYHSLASVNLTLFDRVICATGWQTDFERRAMAGAVQLGITCIAYIDHWVNYRTRFEIYNQEIKVDEIWVVDEKAKQIAKREFGDEQLVNIVPNAYEDSILEKVENFSEKSALVCLEPIRLASVDQTSIYDKLIERLNNEYSDCPIRIRKHPSGEEDGYEYILNKIKNLNIQETSDLVDDLNHSSSVFGFQSSVFSLANKAGRKVFSYYPSTKIKPLLPHDYINYLN